jgi:methylglutaconyl-CoA hydratase
MQEPLDVAMDPTGVLRIVLNRAARANSIDPAMAAALSAALEGAAADRGVRALVLSATGRSFCAGVDLAFMKQAGMKQAGGESHEANRDDAEMLGRLLQRLAQFPAPTLALVQGGAIGLGVGLVACCDIALASEAARFRFSEVRLGIIPAVISPHVIAAMGARACRRYFLTAETFAAEDAARFGLVHAVVPAERLASAGEAVLGEILAGRPLAQRAAKALIEDVRGEPLSEALIAETARRLADIRGTAEAQEALGNFLARGAGTSGTKA